ncbi:MAG: hypothetical protein ABSD85_14940 [Acidimicrobiales bacterium]|jgi:hypothetical protein
MVRRLGAIATVAITLIPLAACTSSTAKPTGVVTGVADACGGVRAPGGHVKVSLYSGSRAVTSETVRSGARYRFVVKAGEYQVMGWWGSKDVTVRAGHSVTANFRSTCV